MKLTNFLAYLVSAFLISFIKSTERSSNSKEKNEFCPRTVLMRINSEKELMKCKSWFNQVGYRCASVNEDDLAYQYYLKAIEAANYSGKVMRKVAKKLNQNGKQALSKKILNTAKMEKAAQKGKKKTISTSTRKIYSKLLEWAKKYNAKIGPIEIRELSEINRYFVSNRDILVNTS